MPSLRDWGPEVQSVPSTDVRPNQDNQQSKFNNQQFLLVVSSSPW